MRCGLLIGIKTFPVLTKTLLVILQHQMPSGYRHHIYLVELYITRPQAQQEETINIMNIFPSWKEGETPSRPRH